MQAFPLYIQASYEKRTETPFRSREKSLNNSWSLSMKRVAAAEGDPFLLDELFLHEGPAGLAADDQPVRVLDSRDFVMYCGQK